VLDSLQSLVRYKTDEIVITLERLRKEAQKLRFALVVIGEERKDGTDYLGSASIGHIADVPVNMTVGHDEEVVISTPNKNRDTGDTTSRCFFRRTKAGFSEISESETGYRPRHTEKSVLGLAAFIAQKGNEFYADEMTAAIDTCTSKVALTIAGINNAKAKSLLVVLQTHFVLSEVGFVLKANQTEKNLDAAELACTVAVLSLVFGKPIPVDTIFIGGVDNRGYLLPVPGLEQRVKRAEDLGYKRIIGPKAIGTQLAIWQDVETIEGVWETLGFTD
jgi:DNA repair protein RadA/Sms